MLRAVLASVAALSVAVHLPARSWAQSSPAATEASTASPAEGAGPLLLVLTGSRDAGNGLAQGLRDLALRDGATFLDLRPELLPPTRASLELGRAVAAFQEFNYGKALQHLEEGLQEARERGAEGLSQSELSDLYIYRAMVKNAQGDAAAAWDDFLRAVTIEPGRHLDAVRFTPSVVSSFERAREQVASGPHTKLVVEAADGCEIFVDGRATPAGVELSLPSGDHLLRTVCRGYEPAIVTLPMSGERVVHQSEPRRPRERSEAELLDLAKQRGFAHLLWARASSDPLVGASASLALLESSGRTVASTSLGLEGSAADEGRATVAADRLLDALQPEPLVDVSGKGTKHLHRPWYQSPWLWGAVGVASATAILLPFALRDDGGSGFDLRLGGELGR